MEKERTAHDYGRKNSKEKPVNCCCHEYRNLKLFRVCRSLFEYDVLRLGKTVFQKPVNS